MPPFASTPPLWFRIVAAIDVVWGALGLYAWYMQFTLGAEAMGPSTAYDRALFAALPGWYSPLYAVSVGAGFLGAVALLLCWKSAQPLFVVSLIAIVLQFGYFFATTDVIAVKGPAEALGFPIFIAMLAIVQIWLANLARQRGWLR
jgi:hypothetical protein